MYCVCTISNGKGNVHIIYTICRYETTANTLAYAIYLVARHPEVEARLLEEIDRLFSGPTLDLDTVQEFKVMPCCITWYDTLKPI